MIVINVHKFFCKHATMSKTNRYRLKSGVMSPHTKTKKSVMPTILLKTIKNEKINNPFLVKQRLSQARQCNHNVIL